MVQALAGKGGCWPADVQASDIQWAERGQGSLWARLSLSAVKRASEGGYVQVGWSRARVELLDARPLRCRKCLESGHVRETCPSSTDRSNRCYRCGGLGHVSRGCEAPPRCPLCVDLESRPCFGSCFLQKRKGKTAGAGVQEVTPHTQQVPVAITGADVGAPKPQRHRTQTKKKTAIPGPGSSREKSMEAEPLEEIGQAGSSNAPLP